MEGNGSATDAPIVLAVDAFGCGGEGSTVVWGWLVGQRRRFEATMLQTRLIYHDFVLVHRCASSIAQMEQNIEPN